MFSLLTHQQWLPIQYYIHDVLYDISISLIFLFLCFYQSSRTIHRLLPVDVNANLHHTQLHIIILFVKKNTKPQTQTKARLFDKINTKIDLDSPKVATMDKLSNGDKKVYCRCWQSGTFPLCDGSHMAHNKETGDNVGPLIVSVAKAEE